MFGPDVLQRLVSVAVGFRFGCVLVAGNQLICIDMREAANEGVIGDLSVH